LGAIDSRRGRDDAAVTGGCGGAGAGAAACVGGALDSIGDSRAGVGCRTCVFSVGLAVALGVLGPAGASGTCLVLETAPSGSFDSGSGVGVWAAGDGASSTGACSGVEARVEMGVAVDGVALSGAEAVSCSRGRFCSGCCASLSFEATEVSRVACSSPSAVAVGELSRFRLFDKRAEVGFFCVDGVATS
jgi:hypothetical protein